MLQIGHVEYDLVALKVSGQIDMRGHSVATAFFLGAALGGSLRAVRLAGGRLLELAPLRTKGSRAQRSHLGATLLSSADAAFLWGVFGRNPHAEPTETVGWLIERQLAIRHTSLADPEAQELMAQAVQQAMVTPLAL